MYKILWFSFTVCFIFYIHHSLKSQQTEMPELSKKPFVKKTIKIKNSDTIQIDTIVIVYKKKDSNLALKKYKGKTPIIVSGLAGYKNKTMIDTAMMRKILDSPIVIRDSKNNVYKVLSYRFCYKKKDVYIEDEGMEVKTRYDLFCMQMKETPLPEKYKTHIQTTILDGEQFWFEKIIVQNERGENFLSNDISLITY